MVIAASARVLAQPEPLFPLAALKRENTDGATCRAGLEALGREIKMSQALDGLKNPKCISFLFRFVVGVKCGLHP